MAHIIPHITIGNYMMSGPEEGDQNDLSVWVTDDEGNEIIHIEAEAGDTEAQKELGRRVEAGLNNESLLRGYLMLHDGLSDMIESGRLTEADIPDDYRWLVEVLERLANGAGQSFPSIRRR